MSGASTVRRKANEKAAKSERRRLRSVKGIWPAKDADYLAILHCMPCAACSFEAGHDLARYITQCRASMFLGQVREGIEAAHVGDRGLGQKCGDRYAISLCNRHHDRGSKEGHHSLGKSFWSTYGIPKDELIKRLNEMYDDAK